MGGGGGLGFRLLASGLGLRVSSRFRKQGKTLSPVPGLGDRNRRPGAVLIIARLWQSIIRQYIYIYWC